MAAPPDFLIADIMPSRGVHLLCGPSGSGKTTLLFQLLKQWQNGENVFGHKSFPAPYTYVSCDRSRKSVNLTLARLGCLDVITRIIALDDLVDSNHKLETIVETAKKKYSDTELVVIEGVQTLVGNSQKDYGSVSALLRQGWAKCQRYEVTLLGTGHSPKVKENERYLHPRERTLGSVAWGAFADLIIAMNFDEQSKIRTVDVLPRNSAEEQYQFMSGPQGVLVACPKEKSDRLMLFIMAYSEGALVTRQSVHEAAEGMEIASATADRALSKCVEDGVLEKVSEATYKRPYAA